MLIFVVKIGEKRPAFYLQDLLVQFLYTMFRVCLRFVLLLCPYMYVYACTALVSNLLLLYTTAEKVVMMQSLRLTRPNLKVMYIP